jgi:hypothetical protein
MKMEMGFEQGLKAGADMYKSLMERFGGNKDEEVVLQPVAKTLKPFDSTLVAVASQTRNPNPESLNVVKLETRNPKP